MFLDLDLVADLAGVVFAKVAPYRTHSEYKIEMLMAKLFSRHQLRIDRVVEVGFQL